MKKQSLLIAIIFLIGLVGCSPNQPTLPVPNAVYETQLGAPIGLAYWDQNPQAAEIVLGKENVKIGAAELKVYAYGVQEAMRVGPNTPIEYRILVKQAAPTSPPLYDDDLSILLTVIYDDGQFELYGTANMPQVMPSNMLRWDPTKGVYSNPKGIAQNRIGRQRLIAQINYKGQNFIVQETLNVR